MSISNSNQILDIKFLEAKDAVRWDQFVERCPEATFFHKAGWKDVFERAFAHKTFYMFAEAAGVIQAVLPLVQIKSYLFGNALKSTPFCVHGGIAAESELARVALQKRACELAVNLGVEYLEMRNRFAQNKDDKWEAKDLYVSFRKTMDPDPDVNFNAIPRKQRAMVRKGIDAGLTGKIDNDLDVFYRAYSESVRNLGTPVFSKKYFSLLREIFPQESDILTVRLNGEIISSVLSFYFRKEVLPYYAGGTKKAREVKGNDFMYWDLMRRACERGYEVFDYGRSKKGTGAYSFKKNWGFEPEPLTYEYFLVGLEKMPDVSPMNPKYRYFIKLWQKLPLSISMLIGPVISKDLG
jgi:FemAB-related protein (PEP-CTERM system-associated)